MNGVCHRKKKAGEWLWNLDLVTVEAKTTKPKGKNFFRGLNKAEQKSGETFLLVDVKDEPGKWDFEKATVSASLMRVNAPQLEGMCRVHLLRLPYRNTLTSEVTVTLPRPC